MVAEVGKACPTPPPRRSANASRPPHPPDHHGAASLGSRPLKPVPCSPHHRNSTASTRQQGDHGGLGAEVQSKPTRSPQPDRPQSFRPYGSPRTVASQGRHTNPFGFPEEKPKETSMVGLPFPCHVLEIDSTRSLSIDTLQSRHSSFLSLSVALFCLLENKTTWAGLVPRRQVTDRLPSRHLRRLGLTVPG